MNVDQFPKGYERFIWIDDIDFEAPVKSKINFSKLLKSKAFISDIADAIVGEIKHRNHPAMGSKGSREVYHGTNEEAAYSILKDGLKGGVGLFGDGVYAASTLEDVITYAVNQAAFKTRITDKDYQLAAIVVADKKAFSDLEYVTGVMLSKGDIAPKYIKRVELYDLRDLKEYSDNLLRLKVGKVDKVVKPIPKKVLHPGDVKKELSEDIYFLTILDSYTEKISKSFYSFDTVEEQVLVPLLGLSRLLLPKKRVIKKEATQPMIDHFKERTALHISLVQKYLQKIIDLQDPRLDNNTLELEKVHDQSKYEEPEYTPYLHVNWHYYLQSQGEKYDPLQEIKDQMNEATLHHVKNNMHHPEYWDATVEQDNINRDNRDDIPEKTVDATTMPLDYVASMVADWLAMSEEKGTSVLDWVEKNVGKRWEFTDDQINLIDDLVNSVWIGVVIKGGVGSGIRGHRTIRQATSKLTPEQIQSMTEKLNEALTDKIKGTTKEFLRKLEGIDTSGIKYIGKAGADADVLKKVTETILDKQEQKAFNEMMYGWIGNNTGPTATPLQLWAIDSGDSDMTKEGLDDYLKGKNYVTSFVDGTKTYEERKDIIHSAMEKHYLLTQKMLSERYPNKTITLYRGLIVSEDDQDEINKGGVVKLKSLPLSSWTDDVKIANKFGNHLVKMDIPIERIVSSKFSSRYLMTRKESEFIVFGEEGFDLTKESVSKKKIKEKVRIVPPDSDFEEFIHNEVLNQKSLGLSTIFKASPNSLPDRFDFSGWSFNKEEWNRRLQAEGGLFIKEMYNLEGSRAYDGLRYLISDLAGAFNMDDPLVQAFLDEYTFKFAQGINDTTEELLRTTMKTGMSEGLGMDGIAKLIGQAYDDFKGYRSLLIARTETIRASNGAAVMAYKQSEVVSGKEWLTARDERACPLCSKMNGKIIDLDKNYFNLGDRMTVDNDGEVVTMKFDYEDVGGPPLHPNCFIDSQTPIYTSKGWKAIGKIEVDDLVLTHKGRFRKVTQLIRTPKQTPDVVEIYLTEKNGGNFKKLTVTNNHPILLDGKWQEAKNAEAGMKIGYLSVDNCPECQKPIPFGHKYCSESCRSRAITTKQWATPGHRENISKKNSEANLRQYASGERDRFEITKKANEKTRELANEGNHIFQQKWVQDKARLVTNLPEHREASSKRMKENNPVYMLGVTEKASITRKGTMDSHPEILQQMVASYKETILQFPDKHPNRIMVKNGTYNNKLEDAFIVLLDALQIKYERQYPIKGYFVDFALMDYLIAIEVDGPEHDSEKQKEKDLIRQRNIESVGWQVLRFKEKEIIQSPHLVTDELKRIFMNHDGQYEFIGMEIVKVVKRKIAKPRTLYNFSVEEDESYIAKGFVVHNCRCALIPVIMEDYQLPKSIGLGTIFKNYEHDQLSHGRKSAPRKQLSEEEINKLGDKELHYDDIKAGVSYADDDSTRELLKRFPDNGNVVFASAMYSSPEVRNEAVEILKNHPSGYEEWERVSMDAVLKQSINDDDFLRTFWGMHARGEAGVWTAQMQQIISEVGPNKDVNCRTFFPDGVRPPEPHPRAVAILQKEYDKTQSLLSEKEYHLFRGTDKGLGLPMESWSSDNKIATQFAHINIRKGEIYEENIDRKFILATSKTISDWNEDAVKGKNEYVVLGSALNSSKKSFIPIMKWDNSIVVKSVSTPDKDTHEFQFRETTSKYEKKLKQIMLDFFEEQKRSVVGSLKKDFDEIETKHRNHPAMGPKGGGAKHQDPQSLFAKTDQEIIDIESKQEVLNKDIFQKQLEVNDFMPGGKYEEVTQSWFGFDNKEDMLKQKVDLPDMLGISLKVNSQQMLSKINKFDSQNALYDKLKDNKDFDELIMSIDEPNKAMLLAYNAGLLPINESISAKVQSIKKEVIRNLVDQWAGTSGDTDLKAVAMQMAAKELFGGDSVISHLESSIKDPNNSPRMNEVFQSELKFNPGRKAFLQAQYDATQDYLKKNDIKEVILYRGVEGKRSKLEGGNDVEVSLQPLSSFSTDIFTAKDFAIGGDTVGRHPSIIASIIPASKIFAMPNTGISCTGEREVVVLGGKIKATIIAGNNEMTKVFEDGAPINSAVDLKRNITVVNNLKYKTFGISTIFKHLTHDQSTHGRGGGANNNDKLEQEARDKVYWFMQGRTDRTEIAGIIVNGAITTVQGKEDNSSVLFTQEQVNQMEYMVHNHPGGASFSGEDVALLLWSPTLKKMEVIGSAGTIYSLEKLKDSMKPNLNNPDLNLLMANSAKSDWDSIMESMKPGYQKRFENGEDSGMLWKEHSHLVMEKLALEKNLLYKRTKIVDKWFGDMLIKVASKTPQFQEGDFILDDSSVAEPPYEKKKKIGLGKIFKHLDGTDNDHDQSSHGGKAGERPTQEQLDKYPLSYFDEEE